MGVTALLNRDFQRATVVGINSVDVVVPGNQRWLVKSITTQLVTAVGAGNRVLVIEFLIGGVAVDWQIETPITTAVDLTAFGILGQGVPLSASKQGQTYTIPLPEFVLLPTDVVRVRDSADIDDTNDVLTVGVHADIEYVPTN